MGIRVTRTGKKFGDLQITTTALMREIGEGLLLRIRDRTKKGIGADGRAFRPLSPLYAAQKQKALGHSRPDLMVSGRMLQDMILSPGPSSLTISFLSGGGRATGRTLIQRSRSVGAADKAFWHNISGAGRARILRPFFDLNPADEQFVVNRIDAHLTSQTR